MFQIYAEKNRLVLQERETLTSGSVNVYPMRFEFSEDWEGLDRTAVFRCGGRTVYIRLDGSGECGIPWETLQEPGLRLEAGVYGQRGGETVLPTVWAKLGTVLPGVSAPEGQVPPTPELWTQALDGKGDGLRYTGQGELGLYAGEKLLSSVPVSGGGSSWGIGHGLSVQNGNLTVETTDGFDSDKTLPMSAAGVEAALAEISARIEALLGTN